MTRTAVPARLFLATLVAAVAAAGAVGAPCSAAAQVGDTLLTGGGLPGWLRQAVQLSGTASVTSELYGINGADPRRPASAWRLSLSPQATVFGGLSMGLDLLLSSEGSELRQNVNQIGLHPGWKWGRLHLGDFAEPLSTYTVQGTRVRGAGLDLTPGILRFSVQGGRVQRAVAAGVDGSVYRRTLIGGRVGIGRESGSFIELHLLRAKDDPGSLDSLVLTDSVLLDTIPEGFRPEYPTTPQDNMVAGAGGQVSLFRRVLVLRGEGAASLTSRDVRSREIEPDSLDVPGVLAAVFPTRLSTYADYAYRFAGTLGLPALSLRGSYEELGPGYASLGLPYLLNDRRSYRLSGAIRVLENRVQLQGDYGHQQNNLEGQKLATTSTSTATATLMTRWSERLTTTLGAVHTVVASDAAVDTFRLDNRSDALTASVFLQQPILGRPAVLSVSYAANRAVDGNPVFPVPSVRIHSVSSSVQVPLGDRITVAPTVSAVLTRFDGAEDQRNIYLGFRGNGRFMDGRLRVSSNLSRTFTSGREIVGAMASIAIPAPLGVGLTIQARHNRYSAFALRPGFDETFVGLTVSRSFR